MEVVNDRYMATVSEVMRELRKRGYVKDFNLRSDCIYCHDGADILLPEDFQIDRVYRFGASPIPKMTRFSMRYPPGMA